ncbi:MAG: hypothetical protein A2539_08735 [Elusimicrobia bacterium RIFOXYD2_FULL_34_15]|nr:MAG: hypothetical protein A2539_08735 [Elusimicrobia bacterium RIFOXYD2_FULL_34_15]
MQQKIVKIRKEREQRIIFNKHPWIFSGAVENVSSDVEKGDIVSVADSSGNIFAQAVYNPRSDIRLRVISWNKDESVGIVWLSNKIKDISENKERLLNIDKLPEDRKNYRVIYSECDNIPGLIVDRYGLMFVVQFQTLFADERRDLWVSTLKKLFNPIAIYERSDVEVRKKEGLSKFPTGILHGEIPKDFFIEEDNFNIVIDIPNGQKTGYFLDLKNARKRVEYWCKTLNIKYLQNYFGYSGSFNLYAARAGVEKIEQIEVSQQANDIASRNSKINGYENKVNIITSDVFDYLTKTNDASVDAIIIDPPSFVKQKDKIQNAFEGYERLNSQAMKKLVKGGLLFTFCCSSYVSEEDFQKILFKSAAGIKSEFKVLEKIDTDADHSWPLNFPEGRYLQGWILQKI